MADFGIGEIAAIASLAGTAVGVAGSISSANAASASAKYNAEVAANNQQIAKQNANQAAAAGEVQTAQQQAKTRAQLGGIIAAQAASGVDVDTGSAVDVQASQAEVGKQDALDTMSKAAQQAYGYETAASGYGDQAALDKSQAANASSAGIVSAGSTLLGGVGNAGVNYAKYLQTSGFNAGDAIDPNVTYSK